MLKKLLCYLSFSLCISFLSACGGGDWEEEKDPLSLKCGDPAFIGPCPLSPPDKTIPAIPASEATA